MGGPIIMPPLPASTGALVRSRLPTKLTIDEWAQFFGINPLHFNQIVIEDEPNAVCGTPWFEHAWQNYDRVSREDISRAIREAETLIESYLGYRLMPSWERDERHPTIRPYRPELVNLNGADIRARFASVRASWGQFIRGGVEALAEIQLAAPIAYSDVDGDGYSETATVTVAGVDPAIIDACEVSIFYPGKGGLAVWEIRPAAIAIVGGVLTATFQRHQCVLDALLETYPIGAAVRPEGVDGFDDAQFLETIDVYRHYNDPSLQCLLGWEPVVGCQCVASSTPCRACVFASQTACLHVRGDGRVPTVAFVPATWDADQQEFVQQPMPEARMPDFVRLWYQAGYRSGSVGCPYDELDIDLKRVIAILAASMLARQVCDCRNIQESVSMWQQDLAFVGGAEQLSRYQISKGDLENPFGTRRGAVYAWKRITGLPEGAIGTAILT